MIGNRMRVGKDDERANEAARFEDAHSAEVVVIHMSAPRVALANHVISVSVMLVKPYAGLFQTKP